MIAGTEAESQSLLNLIDTISQWQKLIFKEAETGKL